MSQAGHEAVPDTPEFRKQTVATYRKALAEPGRTSASAWEAEALTCIAMLEDLSSELKPAAEDFQAALALWKRLGNPQREAEALNWLGDIYRSTQGLCQGPGGLGRAPSHLWHRLGEQFDEAQDSQLICAFSSVTADLLRQALACHQERA